jgi:hypothetical protein
MIKRAPPVPIVIVSFNRLWALELAIASYRQIDGQVLVVHDTGSTHEPLLDYLSALETSGVEVWRNRPSIRQPSDLNTVDETIQAWLSRYPDTSHYVVTDPDICICDGCEDMFDFYRHVLDQRRVSVIGPMLRIDDIPDCYPLRDRVIHGHTERYWSQANEVVQWNGRSTKLQRAVIDTTFGMYPSELPFRRLNDGLRTHAPYWARHLDWYLDPQNLLADQIAYMGTASGVSHWGGEWLRGKLDLNIDPPFQPPTEEELENFKKLIRTSDNDHCPSR